LRQFAVFLASQSAIPVDFENGLHENGFLDPSSAMPNHSLT
jgi:hypothetical protein